MSNKYAQVLLDVSIDRPLTYSIPPELQNSIEIGQLVEVSLRKQTKTGIVLELQNNSAYPNTKPIQKALSDHPFFPRSLLDLLTWMSTYYNTPLGTILRSILPKTIRENKKAQERWIVKRKLARTKLANLAVAKRNTHTAQANVLDVLLKMKKEMLLSDLLAQSKTSRSPVDSLVKQGAITLEKETCLKNLLDEQVFFLTEPKKLNEDQQEAFDSIKGSIDSQGFHTHLLFGVTGSGKTEIYLQAMQETLNQGKQVLYLVPEVSLIEQTQSRIKSRFKESIATLHYQVTGSDRNQIWKGISDNKYPIVLGARSAIFAPLRNLGLVIIDEEHESSYKQHDERPYYHARDIAVMRGYLSSCTVILGSATPSIETYYNAIQDKYILNKLTKRANQAKLPEVHIIDMKREYEQNNGWRLYSHKLIEEVKKRMDRAEQSILFLNRRGYNTSIECEHCGQSLKCHQCDISYTYYKKQHALKCHLCSDIKPVPKQCPECGQIETLKHIGTGTEKAESILRACIPGCRVLRVDGDTTRKKGALQDILDSFAKGDADVLIGTQMIAKGHHFTRVTLAGVINCDSSLNIPDFRASENAFQLITQVSGRAGRDYLEGQVYLQTASPTNSTIQHAKNGCFTDFYNEEIGVRELFKYPPFIHLIKCSFTSTDEYLVKNTIEQCHHILNIQDEKFYELLAPQPAAHSKVKNRYRYQFIVKTNSVKSFNDLFSKVIAHINPPSKLRITTDTDPTSTFF